MIRWLVLMVGLAAGLAFGQHESDYLVTGQGWHEWSDQMKQGFVIGFTGGYAIASKDSLLSSAPTSKDREAVRRVRCTDSMTIGQIIAVADKYVADHPEQWDHNMMFLFHNAMKKACDDRDGR